MLTKLTGKGQEISSPSQGGQRMFSFWLLDRQQTAHKTLNIVKWSLPLMQLTPDIGTPVFWCFYIVRYAASAVLNAGVVIYADDVALFL